MNKTPITDKAYLSALSVESKAEALLACCEKLETAMRQAWKRIDLLEYAHRKIVSESHDARAVEYSERALADSTDIRFGREETLNN